MNTLLEIRSSLHSADGQSSRLADRYVERWKSIHPGGTVIVRDLAREPVPHLDADRFGAFLARPAERTPAQQAIVDASDALIGELRRADTLVLAVPMYNFGVPSTLKAYFDHVARAGVTFRYTENGSVGLLKDKQAIVFASRGGRHAGTARDSQTPFLRTFLGFIGIDRVDIVYAEGLALDEANRRQAVSDAHARIDALLLEPMPAAA